MADKATQSKALDGFYKVVGVEPGQVHTLKFGTVDLRAITLKQADKLFEAKFPYLQKVSAAQPVENKSATIPKAESK